MASACAMAARMALIGLDEGWGEDFTRKVYSAEFAHGKDIADAGLLERLAVMAGAGPDVLARAHAPHTHLPRHTHEHDATTTKWGHAYNHCDALSVTTAACSDLRARVGHILASQEPGT